MNEDRAIEEILKNSERQRHVLNDLQKNVENLSSRQGLIESEI